MIINILKLSTQVSLTLAINIFNSHTLITYNQLDNAYQLLCQYLQCPENDKYSAYEGNLVL